MTKYITATDMTSTRLTVTGLYARESEAAAAVESDDESGMFALADDSAEPSVGDRIHHDGKGVAWVAA